MRKNSGFFRMITVPGIVSIIVSGDMSSQTMEKKGERI